MSLRALLFGSIGVLADTSALQLGAFNRSFFVHSLDWHWSEEQYRQMLAVAGGQNRIRHYAQLIGQDNLDEDMIRSIHLKKTQVFNASLEKNGVELRPGVLRLIDDARAQNVLCAWVTSTERSNLEAIMHASGQLSLLDKFKHVAHRGNVTYAKPDPAPYAETLETLRIDACEAVAIEDSQICIQSAVAAQLDCIATPNSFSTEQDYSSAVSTVTHLGDRDNPATLLSGMNILDDGMVTIASLSSLLETQSRRRQVNHNESVESM